MLFQGTILLRLKNEHLTINTLNHLSIIIYIMINNDYHYDENVDYSAPPSINLQPTCLTPIGDIVSGPNITFRMCFDKKVNLHYFELCSYIF